MPTLEPTHTHTHTHTHFQVQGLEEGVSENEAPGPIGAYTTTHNDTITLMPNLIHRISFTESHSQNGNSNVARGLPRVHRPAGAPRDTIEHTHLRDQEELVRTCVYRERRKMEEKVANVRRKSEKRKPPRARREKNSKILNYRKWPRRPCRNSMNCVTCRYVIRTSPGGADAHMRTHAGEIEVPTLVPSHRRVKHG